MFECNGNITLAKRAKKLMIDEATKKYKEFMEVLGIDVDNDPNSQDTPKRVVNMLVNELWRGRYEKAPEIKSFPNTKKYDNIIFTNCEVYGMCAHHHVAIKYKIYIGILSNPDPKSRLIGLSKYTRIAEWIANRPSIQEETTEQIHSEINNLCKDNLGLMIYIIGEHGCTRSRGVKQQNSKMITSKCSGEFINSQSTKDEFLKMINS